MHTAQVAVVLGGDAGGISGLRASETQLEKLAVESDVGSDWCVFVCAGASIISNTGGVGRMPMCRYSSGGTISSGMVVCYRVGEA